MGNLKKRLKKLLSRKKKKAKLDVITTNDLGPNLKLRRKYKKIRKIREAKRRKEKEDMPFKFSKDDRL